MRSIAIILCILIASSFAVAQGSLDIAGCDNKQLIGVQIQPTGFRDRAEAEAFAASVMNLDLRPENALYCLVPTAGQSQRRLVLTARVRRLGTDRGQESIKTQVLRSGSEIAIGEVLRRVPGSSRSSARRISRQYTQAPRITLREIQVSIEATLYDGREVYWKGLATKVFTVQEKYFYGYSRPREFTIKSGGELSDLAPYRVQVYAGDQLGYRYEELLKYMTAAEAMQPNRLMIGGQQLQRQVAQQ